jgi:hypothetical protein
MRCGLPQNVAGSGALHVNPVMNDTKWDELRMAMYELGKLSPSFRTKDIVGHVSPWDREWYYHFREGDYRSIQWVDIRVTTTEQDAAVEAALRRIHVPGHRVEHGFRVYGYAGQGMEVKYI